MSLITFVELAAPVDASYLTTGRLWSLVGVALGVAGVVAGVPALRRTSRRAAVVAVAAGAAGTVVGGIVVAAAKGGPGTGYGIVGGWIDLVLGITALALGGLALSRTRHPSKTP